MLVQHPTPPQIDYEAALLEIDPDKDVDGLHPVNMGRLALSMPGPGAVHAGGDRGAARVLRDPGRRAARCASSGAGITLGRPLALLLSQKRPTANAAVTVVHTGVPDWPRVHAAGRHRGRRRGRARASSSPSTSRPGVVVVGGGVRYEGRKLLPDVDERCEEVAGCDHAPRRRRRPDDDRDAVPQRRRGRRAASRARGVSAEPSPSTGPDAGDLPAVRDAGRRPAPRCPECGVDLAGVGPDRPSPFARASAVVRLIGGIVAVFVVTLLVVVAAHQLTPHVRPQTRSFDEPKEAKHDAREDHPDADGVLDVPDEPIIPFIEGDGTGVDIWPAAQLVMDAAAAKHGKTIEWKEVLAGQKAFDATGDWLPDETVDAFREYLIGIKGPLTTPIGGGIRSLNVALRQILDLYVCLRPVRWFPGVPSPVKHPEKVDMVIFRENTEDIYAGLEVEEGTPEAKKLIELLQGRVRLGHPARLRHRHQADLRDRLEAADPRRDRVRGRARPQERHARAQGQHPEVHRGRVPQLGLRARRARSSPTSPSAGTTAAASPATRSS